MSQHNQPRSLPLNVEATESALDKVGEDFPCVGSSLLQWVQS